MGDFSVADSHPNIQGGHFFILKGMYIAGKYYNIGKHAGLNLSFNPGTVISKRCAGGIGIYCLLETEVLFLCTLKPRFAGYGMVNTCPCVTRHNRPVTSKHQNGPAVQIFFPGESSVPFFFGNQFVPQGNRRTLVGLH